MAVVTRGDLKTSRRGFFGLFAAAPLAAAATPAVTAAASKEISVLFSRKNNRWVHVATLKRYPGDIWLEQRSTNVTMFCGGTPIQVIELQETRHDDGKT